MNKQSWNTNGKQRNYVMEHWIVQCRTNIIGVSKKVIQKKRDEENQMNCEEKQNSAAEMQKSVASTQSTYLLWNQNEKK